MRDLWGITPHALNTEWTAEQVAVALNCEEGWQDKLERSRERHKQESEGMSTEQMLSAIGES